MLRHGGFRVAVAVVGLALGAASPGHAVFDDLELSPRARALGGAYAGLSSDASALFYNPAGLVDVDGIDVRFAYFQPFDLGFHRANAVAAAMPYREWGTFGVAYSDFKVVYQDAVLSVERTFTLGHAFTLMEDLSSSLTFGYNVNLYDLDYPARSVTGYDLGSQVALGLDVGFLARLRERTTAGVFAKNVNNPTVGEPVESDLPQRVSGGIAYRPYDGVVTVAELEKELGEEVQFHGGVEFRVVEELALRFGAQTKPNLFDVGVGFRWRQAQVDLSYTHHPVLDQTIRYGVGLRF